MTQEGGGETDKEEGVQDSLGYNQLWIELESHLWRINKNLLTLSLAKCVCVCVSGGSREAQVSLECVSLCSTRWEILPSPPCGVWGRGGMGGAHHRRRSSEGFFVKILQMKITAESFFFLFSDKIAFIYPRLIWKVPRDGERGFPPRLQIWHWSHLASTPKFFFFVYRTSLRMPQKSGRGRRRGGGGGAVPALFLNDALQRLSVCVRQQVNGLERKCPVIGPSVIAGFKPLPLEKASGIPAWLRNCCGDNESVGVQPK